MGVVKLLRGDIFLVRLDPTLGAEVQKTRPCIIISPNEIHQNYHTCIVAPMTSTIKNVGFRVPVVFQNKQGEVMLDQIRSVDKRRLLRKIGKLKQAELQNILFTLKDMFEID